MVLFPYIEQVEAAAAGKMPIPVAPFGTVENPVTDDDVRHETAATFCVNA